jgi:chromosome segregation ATPase
VAFFSSTAAELTRRCDQNKNDIEEIYKQGKETNAKVDQLTTEVGNLKTEVSGLASEVGGLKTEVSGLTTEVHDLKTEVGGLTTDVGGLIREVGNLKSEVGGLTTEVGDFKTRVDERFNRLERILTQSPVVDPSSPLDFLPPEHEQSIRLLESKMNLYSRHTRDHSEELERLRQLSAAHDVRFDALDGQMAEVLSILRSKPA